VPRFAQTRHGRLVLQGRRREQKIAGATPLGVTGVLAGHRGIEPSCQTCLPKLRVSPRFSLSSTGKSESLMGGLTGIVLTLL
jgi:hypothetical protein